MNSPGLWLEFAKLNPERWQGYDGFCQCEVCERYRHDANEWIERRIGDTETPGTRATPTDGTGEVPGAVQ